MERSPASGRTTAWLAVAVAAITILAFAPVVRNDFLDLDDQVNLVHNPWIRGLGRANLAWMLTTFQLGHYQPLSWLTLALDYQLWGLNAGGYHLTSLLLHAANGALLFLLATRLLARTGLEGPRAATAGFVAALLWALHPLRVEAVAWTTARRDVLLGFFTLLTLLAYTRNPGSRRGVALALATALLAFLSKASAMVIPAFLIILDVYPLRRLGGPRGWWTPAARAVWLEKAPFLALGVLAAVVAATAAERSGALRPLGEVSALMRVGAAMYGVGFYVWKSVLPVHLLPMYEYPQDLGPTQPWALAGLATGLSLAAAAIALRRRCPGLAAAFAAYLVAIAPTLGLAQAGPQVVADRYAYLATLGWSMLAGGVLVAGTSRPAYRLAAAPLVVVTLGVATAVQTTTWRDARTAWSRVIALEPTHAFALKSMGDVTRLAGDTDAAIDWYRRALALRPYVDAYTNLAALLAQRGRYDEALAAYRAAIRTDPRYAFAYTSLGAILEGQGRREEAVAAHRQALALEPNLMEAHANLAMTLASLGRTEDARAEYETALRLRPSVEVYNNLGWLLLQEKRPADAAAMFRRALALRPDVAVVHEGLGRALEATDDRAGAAAAFATALRLEPGRASARGALAVLGAQTP